MVSCIVIDDNRDITDAYVNCIKALGIDVLGKGYNGKSAVELYQKVNPDIVFLDLTMPDDDGFYAIEEIKKIEPSANIIAVTDDITDKTRKRLEAKNITLFNKPFSFSDLVKIVKELV